MAIKVGGTEVVSNSRELKNIASIDSGTVTAFNSALNTDPTKGTLTKTFAQNETAEITLSSNVSVGPVVSATKEVPQVGISTKGNWDVNSTASNYDFHNTAANVTLTPSTTTTGTAYGTTVQSVTNHNFPNMSASNLRDIHWKPDGSTFYLLHAGNIVDQYSCSTSWDVTTGTKVYSMNQSGGNDSYGLYIDPTGTYVFVTDFSHGTIYRWEMTTPWRIDTATYQSTYTASATYAYGASVIDIWFSNSGMKMWTLDYSNARVRMYGLTTAYDPGTSTTRHTVTDNTVSGSGFMGFDFSDDGTKIFIGGHHSGHMVRQWSLSTAYDLSSTVTQTTLYTGMPSGASIANVLGDVTFGNSGATMYLLTYGSGGSGDVSQVQLTASSQALSLGSGSFASTDVGKRIVGNGGDVVLTSTSGAFTTTGGSAFTDNSTIAAGSWSMFGLKSAGDVSGITISGFATSSFSWGGYTAVYNTASTYTSNPAPLSLSANADGSKWYVLEQSNSTAYEFTASTAGDITTLSYSTSMSLGGWGHGNPSGFSATNGTKFQASGSTANTIYQATSNNGSVSGIGNYTGYALLTSGDTAAEMFWKPDGTRFYVKGNDAVTNPNPTGMTYTGSGSNLYAWDCSTAWDISSATNRTITFTPYYQYCTAALIDNGTKVLFGSYNTTTYYVYDLTTAWDPTTIDYTTERTQDVASVTPSGNSNEGAIGMHVYDDTVYTISYNHDKITKWPWGETSAATQPTQQYHVAVTNSGGQIDSSAFVDINSMTAAQSAGTGTVHYAVSTDGRTTWSVNKGTDGVRPIVRNNSGTWQYNNDAGTISASYYDLNNASYDNKSFVTSNESGSPREVHFNTNGTKMYVLSDQTDKIWEYDLSTAFDVSTASYNSSQFSVSSQLGGAQGFCFNNNGTKVYVVGENNDTVYQYSLSTAFDITTASYDSVSFGIGGQQGIAGTIVFNGDGTKMFLCGESEDYVRQYTLSTAFNVGTASVASGYLDHSSQSTTVTGMAFNGDGTKLFLASRASEEVIYQYGLTTAYDVSTASYDNVSFNLDQASQFSASLQGIVFNNDGSKVYAMDNGGKVLQYSTGGNVSSYATTATWVDGTVNDELYTLQQALGAQAFNRMDKTQLDAIPDANHFSTGTSLDLMIALRMDTAASTLPTSDGVTLNYDAAALNEGAVLGTDYDFFHPAANKVQIKSLAAQNLKVRVV